MVDIDSPPVIKQFYEQFFYTTVSEADEGEIRNETIKCQISSPLILSATQDSLSSFYEVKSDKNQLFNTCSTTFFEIENLTGEKK
jgi:hypothetical protein